jgi:gamma-glutamyltranspeptidase/glutathione hydrolase
VTGVQMLGGQPVAGKPFYGANDPRRNTGLALGY